MSDTYDGILRERVASIAELDRKIEDVGIAIQNAMRETATVEHTMALMGVAVDLMDVLMEPEQERRIVRLLIESIQIFPEPMPDGLILKSVKFRFPLEYNGVEMREVEADLSVYDSLPSGNHDETIAGLQRRDM